MGCRRVAVTLMGRQTALLLLLLAAETEALLPGWRIPIPPLYKTLSLFFTHSLSLSLCVRVCAHWAGLRELSRHSDTRTQDTPKHTLRLMRDALSVMEGRKEGRKGGRAPVCVIRGCYLPDDMITGHAEQETSEWCNIIMNQEQHRHTLGPMLL